MEGLAELQEELRANLAELGNALKADVTVRCAEMDEHIADVTYNVDAAYTARCDTTQHIQTSSYVCKF